MEPETNTNSRTEIIKKNFKLAGKLFVGLLLLGGLLAAGLVGGKKYSDRRKPTANPHIAFLDEVYSTILNNYWDKITDEQLVNLYVLAAQKINNTTYPSPPKNKKDLEKFILGLVQAQDSEQKKVEFSSNLEDLVLANLQPFGRSRLYSQKQTADLQNRVDNVTGTDQYKVLGLSKDATAAQIAKAYAQQSAKLKIDSSAAAQAKLVDLTHAYNTLSDSAARQNYDAQGAETTIEGHLLRPDILYLKMSKFSPTMVQELVSVTQKFDQGSVLDTLIFDLRDNQGGLIDGLPYILGPFIGPNQYAYQFFQKGQTQDFKTLTGWLPSLVRYKKVIVLINGNTESSAEEMASVMKKYNVGILIGTKTHGWGTVEKVFDIQHQIDPLQKFAVFLVHHLTLDAESQPIEAHGVPPVIDVSDPTWKTQVYNYYHYQPIVDALAGLFKK